LSGAFDVKAELQRAGIEGKLDTVLKQLASDEKIAGGRNDVSREGQLLDYILGNRKITSNESIADADRVGREIVQRMRGPTGQTPIDITPAESNEMYRQVNRHSARLYDADLDPKDAAAITMLANKLYQKTRDSDVAMKTAWKMYMGDAAVQEGERWGGFGSRGRSTLVPQNPMSIEEILGEVAAASPSAQAQPQAAPGGNLSNAFTPPTPQMQRPFYQTPPPAPVAAAPGAAKISPPSPAAEKALLASPTPELKAFFKAKYGYLPPGL
jgi:hypothetical protein